MLKGKKTHIIAALLVLYGVAGFLTGKVSPDMAIATVLEGLGLAALRAGVAGSK